MFRFSLTTNDVQAWTRTGKLVFLRPLGRSNSICLYRHAKKKIHAVCVKNADCTQRKIKFNVGPCGTYESELDFLPKHFNFVPSFPGY